MAYITCYMDLFCFSRCSQGFNGRTCVLKMLCDASNEVSSETGMFRRLYQLIFKWVRVVFGLRTALHMRWRIVQLHIFAVSDYHNSIERLIQDSVWMIATKCRRLVRCNSQICHLIRTCNKRTRKLTWRMKKICVLFSRENSCISREIALLGHC